jgi:multiple sugar transport system permease protein
MKRSLIPYIFLIPFFIHLVILSLFPLGFGMFMSFTNYYALRPISEAKFIGLANYQEALNDPVFLGAIKNAFVYVLYEPVTILIGFFFALVLNTAVKGRAVFRTIFFLPVITSVVAIAFVWSWLYDVNYGPINIFLRSLGLAPVNWLANPHPIGGIVPIPLLSIMIMSIWQYIGLNTVIFLAGLQSIPKELHEAARTSGAGVWHSFRHITAPLLKPTILFCAITATAGSLQVFTEVYTMTAGGPARTTYVPVLMIFDQVSQYQQFGYGAALSYIFFLIILAVSLLEIRILRRGGMIYY